MRRLNQVRVLARMNHQHVIKYLGSFTEGSMLRYASLVGLFYLFNRSICTSSLLALVHISGMPVSLGLFCAIIGRFIGLF